MPRIAYVNGRYVPHMDGAVHIEDRGFQFADGVYEVVTVQDGHLVDEEGHLDRLDRSLRELSIPWPVGRAPLRLILREMVRRNRVRDALLYMQITRGVAPRDFAFPAAVEPSLVMTVRRANLRAKALVESGVSVITIPDIRWKRRDIKSVSLLPQVLGKQKAREAGAFEAWQVDEDGNVTEGCSSNAWIVTADGKLVTRQPSHLILKGITRSGIIRLAEMSGFSLEERPFSVEEAHAAQEAFLTSATTYAMPIVRIDGKVVGNGKPGALTLRLREMYWQHAQAQGEPKEA